MKMTQKISAENAAEMIRYFVTEYYKLNIEPLFSVLSKNCVWILPDEPIVMGAEAMRAFQDGLVIPPFQVEDMEGVRLLRYDLRHHFNMLGTLNAQGRAEDLTVYLKEYGKVYEQLEQQSFSGDPAVDSVLGYYLALAGEEHIPMDLDIQLRKGHGIAHIDMTVLLGNCLENALETVRCLPEEQRRITVELHSEERMVLLRVVNSCEAGADTEGFTSWNAFPSGKEKGGSVQVCGAYRRSRPSTAAAFNLSATVANLPHR